MDGGGTLAEFPGVLACSNSCLSPRVEDGGAVPLTTTI